MWTGLLIAGVVVTLGGLVQGLAGFGLALVAVPILALLDPSLLPVPILITAMAHSVMSLAREHRHVDWHGVGWAMVGRLPGTVIGVLLVDSLDQKRFSLLIGVVVLLSVLLSITAWNPRPTKVSLMIAGLTSGSFGTAMSVGGPPVAMLYQNSPGARVRATLAAYFVLGSVTSVIGLSVAGQVHAHQLLTGLLLIPFLVVGFLLSSPLRKFVDTNGIRVPVLVLSTITAVTLIVRSAIG
ncbi:sulfite exporter TauE/SafE family protein [Umezawaea sp. Da 62-37]|uniref:sulfite exporter TauE/SafE family protein n=1 Tax=Umezawaea sp. Da 62-37 TaxID=3075927 RepID=UPI0028F724DD|nr:sulfite exporter TauE/SafE family protein [Umezawaea sp. Da 62-37]WNV88755.1 sulfite exporter TauE/SafE family protein [Umezawaea sp. Da 62-37]